jgi:hypothetical protein
MERKKVETFMKIAGQDCAQTLGQGSPELRKLGAQLLLSEVLEYIVHGLEVIPEIDGVAIDKPNSLSYRTNETSPDKIEMVDGLADVAYTMFWNACAFKIPLEEAYDLVCNNNLEKFVELENWSTKEGTIPLDAWHCQKNVSWPQEVTSVSALSIDGKFYAVGKDSSGKVRKPSHYKSVDLTSLTS